MKIHSSLEHSIPVRSLAAVATVVAATALTGCSTGSTETSDSKQSSSGYGDYMIFASPQKGPTCQKPMPKGELTSIVNSSPEGQQVYSRLRTADHLSRFGAAAVVGSMYMWSGMHAAAMSNKGRGLLQWSPSYWQDMTKNLKQGENPNSTTVQVSLFEDDLAGRPELEQELRTVDSAREAVSEFEHTYITPATVCLPYEVAFANAVDNSFYR